MSSASSANDALAEYAAGRMTAQQLVSVVAGAYYGEGGRGKQEGLRPVLEVVERAHPGVIELVSTSDRPGFAVHLAERPFPKKLEGDLRQAVAHALNGGSPHPPAAPVPVPGFWSRLLGAIHRVFRA